MAKTPKRTENLPDVQTFMDALLGGSVADDPGGHAVTPRLTKSTRDLPGQQYTKMKKAVKAGPGADQLREWLLAEKAGLPEIHQMPDEEIQAMSDEDIQAFGPDWVGTERPAAVPAEVEAMIAELMADPAAMGMIEELIAGVSGEEVTPVMKATAAGPMQKPHPDNFSPMSQQQKLLEMILGGGAPAAKSEVPFWEEPAE